MLYLSDAILHPFTFDGMSALVLRAGMKEAFGKPIDLRILKLNNQLTEEELIPCPYKINEVKWEGTVDLTELPIYMICHMIQSHYIFVKPMLKKPQPQPNNSNTPPPCINSSKGMQKTKKQNHQKFTVDKDIVFQKSPTVASTPNDSVVPNLHYDGNSNGLSTKTTEMSHTRMNEEQQTHPSNSDAMNVARNTESIMVVDMRVDKQSTLIEATSVCHQSQVSNKAYSVPSPSTGLQQKCAVTAPGSQKGDISMEEQIATNNTNESYEVG